MSPAVEEFLRTHKATVQVTGPHGGDEFTVTTAWAEGGHVVLVDAHGLTLDEAFADFAAKVTS